MQYISGNPYIDGNAGILGAQGAQAPQGGVLGATPQASGGWFGNDPGAAPSAMHGGLGPLLGNQKAALAFSGLQDALSSFGGGAPTHAMAAQMEQLKDNRKLSLRQLAAQRLQDAKTPEDARAAMLDIYASGGDPAEAMAAFKAGQPTYTNSPVGDNVYENNPFTNQRTLVQPGKVKRELSGGVSVNPFDPTDTVEIPHWLDQQTARARAGAEARADFRAPPKATKPDAISGFQSPASLFGGR